MCKRKDRLSFLVSFSLFHSPVVPFLSRSLCLVHWSNKHRCQATGALATLEDVTQGARKENELLTF